MPALESGASAVDPPPGRDPFERSPRLPVRTAKALWRHAGPSLRFLLSTEVHVYSFAVAANVLISFFPFLVAMLLLCRNVLHWHAATEIILQTVDSYFPQGFGVDFRGYLLGASYRRFSWLSLFLLLFTANGIFVPLEVALNRIWRVQENRTFLRNQVISLGLIFGCGALVLASVSATAVNVQFLSAHFGSSPLWASLQSALLRLFALPVTVLLIFLIYSVLPNARIPWRRLVPSSLMVAVLLEIAKYLNILTWPWLRSRLRNDVPPFVQSISIVLWSFVGTMIILAGAEWSARVALQQPASPPAENSPLRSPSP